MKRKLLLATFVVAGALGMRAQTDVTSTYLTNADFEGTYTEKSQIKNDGRYIYEPNGWTVDYKNVSQWNMTVVKSTDAMASNFTGTYAVPADNNKYMVRFRDNQPSEYIDLSQTITVTETGLYTFSADLIREDGSKINVDLYAGGIKVSNANAGTWENRSFSVHIEAGTTFKVGIKFTNLGADGVKAGADNIKITYTAEDAYANAKDMTSSLTNAAVANGTGWTGAVTATGQQYTEAPDNTYFDCGWNTSANCRQTITLPAGYYILKAATRSMSSMVTEANIYANNSSNSTYNASTNSHREGSTGNLLDGGWAWTRVPFVVPEPAEITIGFYAQTTSQGWAGADNFTLTYYTSEANRDAALVAEAKADAAAWKTKLTGIVSTGALAALQTVIDDGDATVSDVETAISNARAFVTSWSKWLAAKTNMDVIANVTTTEPTKATSRKATYLDAVEAEADDASTDDEINTAIGNIKPAVLNYIKKLTPADATAAPFDLTFMITNPSFSENTMTGWTGTTPNFGNDATQKAAKACEYYQKEFDIYQELTDMVTGNYRLKVKAYQRPGASGTVIPDYINSSHDVETYGTTSEIYVNGGNEATQAIKHAASPKQISAIGSGNESSAEVSGTTYYIPNDMVSAVAYFNAGKYENEADILATTSTIKFGFRSTANHVDYDWTIFDDFRLYYTGQLDLSTFISALATKVSEANTLKTSLTSKIPAAALTALQNAIDANDNDDDAFEEEEQFTAAISAIGEAMDAANALVTPYANYNALRPDIQALYDVTKYEEVISGAHETLGTALSTAATDVAAATTVDGINTVITTLKAAGVTYAGTANPTDDAQFDLTFMLTNPDVTSFWDGTWGIAPEGWYKDQSDGNFQVMQNNDVDAEDGTHKIFMEYYYLNNGKTYDNDKFNIYTKATLPVGTYTMNCYAFAKEQNYSSGAANPQVYFYANDTQGSLVNSDILTEQSISFVNTSEQEVKIGLKPLTGNTYNWMGIGYVQLYKVPAQVYTIDEGTTYDNTQSGAGDVTLTRTIIEGYNTLVLPFSMTQEEVEAKFGEGSVVYVVSKFENDNITFATREGIAANEPCLLKATEAGTSYTIADRTIVAGTPTKAATDVTMVGNYAASAKVPQGTDYYVVSGDKLYQVDSDVALKVTRAYIQLSNTSSAKARVLTMSFDGNASDIEEIATETKADGVLYNLAGQMVTADYKGIVLKNGKKYFNK